VTEGSLIRRQAGSSVDLISQVQSLRTMTKTLEVLSVNPSVTTIMDKDIRDLNLQCITNMEEAVETVKSATDLMESITPDFQIIVDTLIGFNQLKNPEEILRESAVLLRQMKPLMKKTSTLKENDECPADGGLGSFSILARQMAKLSKSPGLSHFHAVKAFLEQSVPDLERSAEVVSAVSTFNSNLKSISEGTAGLCKGSFQYAEASMGAMGEMMDSTADFLSSMKHWYGKTQHSIQVVGRLRFAVTKLRQITKVLGTQFGALEDEMQDCSTTSSALDIFGSADTLEDLSNVVEDIGIDNLEKQFNGISFDFNAGF